MKRGEKEMPFWKANMRFLIGGGFVSGALAGAKYGFLESVLSGVLVALITGCLVLIAKIIAIKMGIR
jgi:hypothetical protein